MPQKYDGLCVPYHGGKHLAHLPHEPSFIGSSEERSKITPRATLLPAECLTTRPVYHSHCHSSASPVKQDTTKWSPLLLFSEFSIIPNKLVEKLRIMFILTPNPPLLDNCLEDNQICSMYTHSSQLIQINFPALPTLSLCSCSILVWHLIRQPCKALAYSYRFSALAAPFD